MIDKEDPMAMAKMYDYVVHEDSAADSSRGGGINHCALGQRRLRHAIERHPAFDEAFALWQQHHWKGTGYSGWQQLPTLRSKIKR